jgi:rRNA maturation RNase YbeY
MISYHTHEVKMPKFPRRIVSSWINSIAQNHQKRVGEIAYIFCSEKKILEVNQEYLSHNYLTDIITFDYSSDSIISGDIFISIDTVRSNAIKFKVPYQNELYRVIIHGILHLCGIPDKSTQERAIMEKCENEALALLLPQFD